MCVSVSLCVCPCKNFLKLEKMAIDDALPLKAARHYAGAKLKFFGALNLSCRQAQCRFI